jgi:uncharacterized protein (TIGR02611 family)
MTSPVDPEPQPPTPLRVARKVAVGVTGGVVTAAGVVMLVTPGPGIVAIVAGLGILSSEFPTARRTLNRLRRREAEPAD